MKEMNLYNTQKRFERMLERVQELEISVEDKAVIYKFKDYCLSQGIGLIKIERYLHDLIKLTQMLHKPLEKARKDDLMRVVAELNQSDLSEQTKKGFKIMLRRLYRILRGVEAKGEYPEEVKWISIHINENHRKLPEELLTEEEIKDIVKNCRCLRDKALIATLAESGCRISEIGLMKIKHVSFEEYGARLTVAGKTGMRKVLIINSAPYLQEWINQHPMNDAPDAWLWYNPQRNGCLSYTRIKNILQLATKHVGIKKRVHPHLLRHSRATSLASIMSDASMKHYFGWTQGSKMASFYIHMSGKETDEAILLANGIKINKEQQRHSTIQPKICLKCKTKNEATNRFCKICGMPLNEEDAQNIVKAEVEKVTNTNQINDIMNSLLKDPQILELIRKKISQEEDMTKKFK